jgi:hypothetical protein
LAGAVEFDGGEGINGVNLIGGTSLKIGTSADRSSIHFTGGAAEDSLIISGANVSLVGAINFTGSDGSNYVSSGSQGGILKIGATAAGTSIVFSGGTGDDNLQIFGASVALAGGIDFTPGPSSGFGSQILNVAADHVKVGKIKATGLSIASVGGAGSELAVGGTIVSLAGGILLEGGAYLGVDGVNVVIGKAIDGKSINVIGGSEAVNCDFAGVSLTLKGQLSFAGGGGDDSVDLTFANRFTAASVLIEGNGGKDSFFVDLRPLKILGSAEINGGNGNDYISFAADGRIHGNLMLDLGAGDSGEIDPGDEFQWLFLSDATGLPGALQVLGDLSVLSAGTLPSPDEVILRNLVVGKDTTIVLGDGASLLSIDNLLARGTLSIQTRGGNDIVRFERDSYFGPSVVTNATDIQLGDGDDELFIGDTTAAIAEHNRVRFLGPVVIDGGAGVNTRNSDLEDANTFGSTRTITGF